MNTQKTVVVTGGMGGVGRALARLFAGRGYRVAVLYRSTPQEEVDAFAASLEGDNLFIRCDITDSKESASAVDAVYRAFGHVDAVIHAATGPIIRKRLLETESDAFRNQFDVSVFGAFNIVRPIAKNMQHSKSGTIIGITSTVVDAPETGLRMGSYAVSKIALRGLLRELHRELHTQQVRVFAVAPSLMQTALTGDLPEKVFEIVAAQSATKSIMQPEEVAEYCYTLCTQTDQAPGTSHDVASGMSTPL